MPVLLTNWQTAPSTTEIITSDRICLPKCDAYGYTYTVSMLVVQDTVN